MMLQDHECLFQYARNDFGRLNFVCDVRTARGAEKCSFTQCHSQELAVRGVELETTPLRVSFDCLDEWKKRVVEMK